MLLRQLGLRFGQLPEGLVRRVRAADTCQLDAWTERILTASALEEVLDGDSQKCGR